VDPHPLTLRELVAMAEGRIRENWNHTAQLMALTANINRDPKRKPKPYSPADFHPMENARQSRVIPADITVLRDIFVTPHQKG
jgi:hypothetical protein